MAGTVVRRFCREDVWVRAGDSVDRAPSLDALRVHRVQLLAAWLWRARGRTVPTALSNEVRLAAVMTVAAPLLLQRARAAYEGRVMLMKGLEVGMHYPDPGCRYFQDLDLLVDEPESAHRALIGAGFTELQTGRGYSAAQHLSPLMWPGVPLVVELHRRPNCPVYLSAPPTNDLLAVAVPSAPGIDGLLAPAPAAHALLLVAHAWTHLPLGRLGDLIDLAVILPPGERAEGPSALASRWGWERMWRTTLSVADTVLANGPRSLALRTWARHLSEVRELSVLENHTTRLVAPTFALPPRQAADGVALAVRSTR